MLGCAICDFSLITIHISDCRQFSDSHISQGSVQTCLGCDGIVKFEFVANLPVSLPVKEFWKSVNIWGSYGQEFSVLFFWDTVYKWGVCNGSDIINADVTDTEAWGHRAATSTKALPCLIGSQLVACSVKVTTDYNMVIHLLTCKWITQTMRSISQPTSTGNAVQYKTMPVTLMSWQQ